MNFVGDLCFYEQFSCCVGLLLDFECILTLTKYLKKENSKIWNIIWSGRIYTEYSIGQKLSVMPADSFNQNWIDTLCMQSQHAWHFLRKIDKFNCFLPRLWKPTIMQIRGPSIFWRQQKIDIWETPQCGRNSFQNNIKIVSYLRFSWSLLPD